MSTDPSDPLTPAELPEPDTHPSSTPDGPSTIPTHGSPMGDPATDPGRPGGDQLDEVLRGSNPNSGGPAGLSGDMGVSSERTGPAGDDHRGAHLSGTGSKGGAVGRSDGGLDTAPTPWDAVDVSQRDVNPMPEGSEQLTGASERPHGAGDTGIDRTVGEPMPNPIPDEKLRRVP